uniref:DDE Tnp4 domain-containing protein n=1 Tax=Hucho hucho TaxID=62062 RepID=A0A4W5M648_9TELE
MQESSTVSFKIFDWRGISNLLSSGPKPVRTPAPDCWSQDRPDEINYRESISPVERLAICLPFLATGDSYWTIGFSFGVGRSTVAGIVPSVAQAIWDCLVGEYIPVHKEEDWRAIAAEFLERWNFPNCLGSIAGKHVVVPAPPCSDSQFYNKGTYSVVLLAVVDAIYCFRVVDVGAYGKGSDGRTLRDCLWPGTSGWHPGDSTTCITPWG